MYREYVCCICGGVTVRKNKGSREYKYCSIKCRGIGISRNYKHKNTCSRDELVEKAKTYSSNYYAANRETIKARSAKWREDNPERSKANTSAYRIANKEKAKSWFTAWYKSHPAEYREIQERYRLKNKDKKNIATQNHRARKKANGGKLSKGIIQKLLMLQKGKCPVCKADLRKTGYHLDHVVPIAKGGKNEDKNVQLLCPTCNRKKWSKDPIQFMQEMGYLL